jgi:hypothetical protein
MGQFPLTKSSRVVSGLRREADSWYVSFRGKSKPDVSFGNWCVVAPILSFYPSTTSASSTLRLPRYSDDMSGKIGRNRTFFLTPVSLKMKRTRLNGPPPLDGAYVD